MDEPSKYKPSMYKPSKEPIMSWGERFYRAGISAAKGIRYENQYFFVLDTDPNGFPKSAEDFQRWAEMPNPPEEYKTHSTAFGATVYGDSEENPQGKPVTVIPVTQSQIKRPHDMTLEDFSSEHSAVWYHGKPRFAFKIRLKTKEELDEEKRKEDADEERMRRFLENYKKVLAGKMDENDLVL